MNRSEAAALHKLGPKQLEVLLWIGARYGLQAHAKISSPLQHHTGSVRLRDAEALASAVHTLQAQRLKAVRALNSKNGDPEKLNALRSGRPDILWSAEAFLGRPPTRSESAILSDSLAKLQKRGLVYLTDGTRGEGKKSRVRFVRLTTMGVDIAARMFTEQVRADDEAFLEQQERRAELARLYVSDDVNEPQV